MGSRRDAWLSLSAVGLAVAGAIGWLLALPALQRGAWLLAAAVGLASSIAWVWESLRRGRLGVDIVAVLALAGAIATDEPLAGAMLTLMLTTGRLLESRAEGRARRELGLLAERAPRTARRVDPDGVHELAAEAVRRGDRLMVGPGEIVPVDGRLQTFAVLDESLITGEPLPVERAPGAEVRSGCVNRGHAFQLVATSLAADSTHAQIVRLMAQAQAESSPSARAADRYAAAFVPFTLVLSALAWAASGTPVRAVAVLVVATPCPLLLAVPIAILSGLSRAARWGVVVKGGEALERLANGRVMLFDKTGTLTRGQPALLEIVTAPSGPRQDEVLWLAASLDQVSAHAVAFALMAESRRRGLSLPLPETTSDHPGRGLEGVVAGRAVRVGKGDWVLGGAWPDWARLARRRASLAGAITVFVAIDGRAAGAFLLEDPIRPDAPRMLRALRRAGIERIVLVTGDRAEVAESVGRIMGVDDVRAGQDPARKVDVVRTESRRGATIMVGDGVNDAPALAAATVGVAMGARGASVTSEAAGVVLTRDRIDALADAMLVARRAVRIARESACLGMGLSVAAMLVAAGGWLPPPVGAVLQEAIDLLALGSALRAAWPGPTHSIEVPPALADLTRRFNAQHLATRGVVERIRSVADGLHRRDPDLARVAELLLELEGQLLPHEQDEEAQLFPVMTAVLGEPETVANLSRTHAEIGRQLAMLRRFMRELDGAPPGPEDVLELRRLLYGLYAVLRLHKAMEEENLYSLVGEADDSAIRAGRGGLGSPPEAP